MPNEDKPPSQMIPVLRIDHLGFGSRAAIALCALLLSGCSDSLGPIPAPDEIVVQISVAEVNVRRYEPNGYAVDVPLTIVNNSRSSVFSNGYCFAEWERLEGTIWKPIERDNWCSSFRDRLDEIPAHTTGIFSYGSQRNGPGPATLPDFAKPGQYRFKVLLYRDVNGRRQLPVEFGVSNSFSIVGN